MKQQLRAIPFLLMVMVAMYLLPLAISDTGSAMMVLLIGIPVLCFLAGFLYGWRCGFVWWFPVAVGILFLPTIWLYYNTSAWAYTIVYAVFALVGNFFGKRMHKHKS